MNDIDAAISLPLAGTDDKSAFDSEFARRHTALARDDIAVMLETIGWYMTTVALVFSLDETWNGYS